MKILITIVGIALLAGCSVRTPGASVSIGTGWGYDDGYYRSGYYHDHRDEGYFCPPGQAKKGRC